MSSVTPEEVGSFFLSLIVPIITGAVAAGFTAYFALNRFYREKWWEKKHASYNQLIDTLFEIKAIYSYAFDLGHQHYHADMRGNVPPDGVVDWDKYHRLNAQLHRFYVLSPISLSNNTRDLLSKFFAKSVDSDYKIHEEGFPDFIAYNEMSEAAQELIDAIVLDAESELKFK
ncbi:TPA: hypothetical protein ACF92G_000251 [Klebsiella pneumoniae]|nr:hypothetical protein [Klebsiella pneumoniae]